MTVAPAYVRPPDPKPDLLEVFRHYKNKYGADFLMVLTGMHIEALEKIAALETRLERLEQRRK